MSDPGVHQLVNQSLGLLVLDGLYVGMINSHLSENTIWCRDGKKKKMSSRKGQTFKINESEKATADQDPVDPVDLSSTSVANYLDNGMTAVIQKHGYYELSMNKYNGMTRIDVDDAALAFDDTMEPAIQFIAEKAGLTKDIQARRKLMQAYDSGLTYVTTASGTSTTSLAVKNINGFEKSWVSGVPTAVSGSNPIEVTIVNGTLGTVTRNVTGVSAGTRDDNSDMIPGTLTISVAVSEIAIGDPITSEYVGAHVLPGGKTTSYNLAASDKMTFLLCSRIVAHMMAAGIRPHSSTGLYHFTGDTEHFNHFWEDSVFRNVFQGQYNAEEVRNGKPAVIQNIMFQFSQNPARNTNESGVEVHRALITGDGVLDLGVYEKDPKQTYNTEDANHFRSYDAENNIHHIIRKPIDVLGDRFSIAYKAYWGFAARTDSLAAIGNFPNSPYKRGVMLTTA